jgi:paraquat-inducible protein A
MPGLRALADHSPLAPRTTAVCARCSTVLHRASSHPIDHSIALTLAALALLVVMCSTTLMSVETAAIAHSADLFSGPAELVRRNMAELAVAVVFVTVLAPFCKLTGTLYVLLRLRGSAPPRHLRRVFVLAERLRPWSMIEVFVFGVFVAYVKLGDLVHITLDAGVYALLALTGVVIWADSALDREAVWERLDRGDPERYRAGSTCSHPGGTIGCEICRLVTTPRADNPHCPRCGTWLHSRKPNSIGRTWALIIAAAVLYLPANYFPVLTVVQLGAGSPSTILGGVEELISSGDVSARGAGVLCQHRGPDAEAIGSVIHALDDANGKIGVAARPDKALPCGAVDRPLVDD